MQWVQYMGAHTLKPMYTFNLRQTDRQTDISFSTDDTFPHVQATKFTDALSYHQRRRVSVLEGQFLDHAI